MKYAEDTIFVVGTARAGNENPITALYTNLILALVIAPDTGEIIDAEMNSICKITNRFVHQLLVGHSLYSDFDTLVDAFSERYLGSCRKALINCLKDAKNRLATTGKLME